MRQSGEDRVQPQMGRVLGRAAGALLFAAVLCQAGFALAARTGGGGFHGGGGGFHGGGFHGGGFHGGRFLGGGFYGGGVGVLGWPYYGYPYGWDYPYYGYDTGQPNTSQTWYYCSDPAGY